MQPICIDCVWLLRGTRDPKLRCEAFMDGIPNDILEGRVDHHIPYAGDGGIVFKHV